MFPIDYESSQCESSRCVLHFRHSASLVRAQRRYLIKDLPNLPGCMRFPSRKLELRQSAVSFSSQATKLYVGRHSECVQTHLNEMYQKVNYKKLLCRRLPVSRTNVVSLSQTKTKISKGYSLGASQE